MFTLMKEGFFLWSCLIPIMIGYDQAPYWFVIVFALAMALWHFIIVRRRLGGSYPPEADLMTKLIDLVGFSAPYLVIHTALYSMSRLLFSGAS